jgi:hypothetical protein
LKQVGIPPLHIVRVEAAHEQFLFEFSGDQAAVLQGWRL